MSIPKLTMLLSGALFCLVFLVLLPACSTSNPSKQAQARNSAADTKSLPAGDLTALRKQLRAAEERVHKLEALRTRLYPGGPVILVDTAQSKISLELGTRVVAQGTCSTGNGMELIDSAGKRAWTFDTPRGNFRVIGKVADPVWYRPDWSYIEEGEPIPKDRSQRATANVLGDYAIAFGNGFYIHGTLYTRLLGANVTHGCIRVNDDVLKKLYEAAQPGTPIWIY